MPSTFVLHILSPPLSSHHCLCFHNTETPTQHRKSDQTKSLCFSQHLTRTHTASSLSLRHKALFLPQTKSLPFLFPFSLLVYPVFPARHRHSQTPPPSHSQFGLLFQEIAERTQTKITHHGFDSAVVQIHQDDMTKFMDELTTALLDDPSVAD